MAIKYDSSSLQIMHLFEQVTGAKINDFFEDELLKVMIFVVSKGEIGKALGKKGVNIKKLQEAMKKKIKVVQMEDSVEKFVCGMVSPLKVRDVVDEEGIVVIYPMDSKTRGLIIGRNAQNLRNLEKNVQRYYSDVREIKVA